MADLLRLERGIPVFGIDMDESNNPIECGLDDAISFDKGCYVGQEVVSKATYVGGVGRYLRPLLIATDHSVPSGAQVLSDDGKSIGHVTSSAFSPAFGRTVALAFVKRTFAQPGQRLRIGFEQQAYDAEVRVPAKEGSERDAIK